MNVAGTYQQGQTIRQTNIDAAATIEQINRRNDRQYEFEQNRLTKIGMSIFGDTMKKMSEDISYATGGYLLDQNIRMKQLDVAAAVQERLADEAVSAGALISFDPGPDPDQAVAEVQEIADNSKRTRGIPAGREGTTYAGPPVPATGEEGSTAAGPPVPTKEDRRTEYVTERKDKDIPVVAAGQDASKNIDAVRQRSAERAARPSQPRRPKHTRIGTTEIFANPTTGGMFARTAKGLVVPINDSTFRNLIGLQQSNAEIHMFNQIAAYKDAEAGWLDSITNEQLAANKALANAMIDSHLNEGAIDESLAESLREAANSGADPESILRMMNEYARRGPAAGDNYRARELASVRSGYERDAYNTSKMLTKEIKGLEDAYNSILAQNGAQTIGEIDPSEPVRRELDALKRQIDATKHARDQSNLKGKIYGDLSAHKKHQARSLSVLEPEALQAFYDYSLLNAGITGSNHVERRENFRRLVESDPTQAAKVEASWKTLHDHFGLVQDEASAVLFAKFTGQEISREDVAATSAGGLRIPQSMAGGNMMNLGSPRDGVMSQEELGVQEKQIGQYVKNLGINITRGNTLDYLLSDTIESPYQTEIQAISQAFNQGGPDGFDQAKAVYESYSQNVRADDGVIKLMAVLSRNANVNIQIDTDEMMERREANKSKQEEIESRMPSIGGS